MSPGKPCLGFTEGEVIVHGNFFRLNCGIILLNKVYDLLFFENAKIRCFVLLKLASCKEIDRDLK
jgi:hypothetical protein